MTISNPISHHLGPIKGWRYKRLHIAVALRKQGWSYTKIADYLFIIKHFSYFLAIKLFLVVIIFMTLNFFFNSFNASILVPIKIAEYLFMTPKTIMRDIKCLAIKAHCSKKYKFYSKLEV